MQPGIEVIEPGFFAGSVADEIVASINDAVQEHGYCSMVLAGGSTPASVYRAMACPPRVEDIEWDKLLLFLGDERWVPPDDNQSNLRMVRETMLAKLPRPHPRLFGVDTSLASPAQGAEQYSRTIADEVRDSKDGLPIFDLVLLGMGDDGHTASIFPGMDLSGSGGKACIPANNPHDGSQRVTLTPGALFGARRILFIVTGESKAETVRRVLNKEADPLTLPARLHESAGSRVTWFLDSLAAKKLKR